MYINKCTLKEIRIVVFEWDEDKNIANIRKHGISFDDAVFVLKILIFWKHMIKSIPVWMRTDGMR